MSPRVMCWPGVGVRVASLALWLVEGAAGWPEGRKRLWRGWGWHRRPVDRWLREFKEAVEPRRLPSEELPVWAVLPEIKLYDSILTYMQGRTREIRGTQGRTRIWLVMVRPARGWPASRMSPGYRSDGADGDGAGVVGVVELHDAPQFSVGRGGEEIAVGGHAWGEVKNAFGVGRGSLPRQTIDQGQGNGRL